MFAKTHFVTFATFAAMIALCVGLSGFDVYDTC